MLANHRRREIGTVAAVVIVNRCDDDDGEERREEEQKDGRRGQQSGVVSSVLCSVPRLKKETEALLMDGPRRYDAMLGEFCRECPSRRLAITNP